MEFKTFDIFETDKINKIEQEPIRLIEPSSIGLLVGKPGAGKTSLIKKMLQHEDCLFKQFHEIIGIGPNFGNCQLDGIIYHDIYSVDFIFSELSKISDETKEKKVLIIFDDVISDINKDSNNAQLQKLFYNRRWIIPGVTISIIITTQKYSLFPAKFRGVLSWIISFQIPNDDFKKLIKEHFYETKPALNMAITQHFQKNLHNFIFIKLDKFGIFLNFKKIC